MSIYWKCLFETFSSSTFNTNARPLPTISGDPAHMHLTDPAPPYAAHTPIPVPFNWKDEVQRQLYEDVDKGIIRKVPPGSPVDQCTRMVCVPKHDGSPRRTVDFRETHPSTAPFDSIPTHMYMSKTDAHNGYHQVALD